MVVSFRGRLLSLVPGLWRSMRCFEMMSEWLMGSAEWPLSLVDAVHVILLAARWGVR